MVVGAVKSLIQLQAACSAQMLTCVLHVAEICPNATGDVITKTNPCKYTFATPGDIVSAACRHKQTCCNLCTGRVGRTAAWSMSQHGMLLQDPERQQQRNMSTVCQTCQRTMQMICHARAVSHDLKALAACRRDVCQLGFSIQCRQQKFLR